MKKILLGVVIGIMLASASVFAVGYTALRATFEIYVNGEKFESPQEPVVIEGRTYLPVRALSEALDVPINWNEKLRRVEIGTETKPSKYSINNPAPFGESQVVEVDTFMEKYKAQIEIIGTVRGEHAEKIILETNRFNKEPKQGHEYILVKIKYNLLDIDDDKAKNLTTHSFTAYSKDNVKYKNPTLVIPSPINTQIYKGGTTEGWVSFEVRQGDEIKIGYGQIFDGSGGVWFNAE